MLVSVKEVEQELGVSVHISMSVLGGEIPAYRINKHAAFDLECIQRILLSKRLSRIARPRGARSPAKAGGAPSPKAPDW
ncbi:MAG TPA: hypothetical protein VK901_05755 [Nitrospiraceae bacterium]|nr:hypothetical protein [Nitrospiraceae bacterium]